MAAALCGTARPTASGESWALAAPLNVARGSNSVSLLPDGRVLVAGGYDGTAYSARAEVYNPATNVWMIVPSMSSARANHTATTLSNGRVLVVGGVFSATGVSQTAEIYDPVSNGWSPTPLLNYPRASHAATLLKDGRVLVTGGYQPNADPYQRYQTSAEIYDPGANTWTLVAPMNIRRVGHAMVTLSGGRVLVAGGANYAQYESTAEVYDPIANTWTLTPNMSTQRIQAGACSLPNGQVLVAGGAGVYAQASAEIFDPSTNSWLGTGSMSVTRFDFVLVRLSDGRCIAIGGAQDRASGVVLSSVDIYDPATGVWSATANLNQARYETAATQLVDGRVLVAGGLNGSTALAAVEVWGTPSLDDDSAFAKLNGSNTFTADQRINGTVTATMFAGDGSKLTNVTAAYATSAGSANFATSAGLAANASALGGAPPATTATPGTIAARDGNGDLFANSFHGSGAALTGIPAAALPGTLVYNNQANSFSGNQTINGQLQLPSVAQTAGTPSASQILTLNGWDGANPTTFQWLVTGAGKLDLQAGTSGKPPADSGLMIAPNGTITFAAGQTFPGAQTALTAGAGIGIGGNIISNTGVLSVSSGNTGIAVGGSAGSPTIANTGVLSFNGRSGATAPAANDYTFGMIAGTVSPPQVAPGTYAINISGNATSATTATSATNANNAITAVSAGNSSALGGIAASNYARLDVGNTFTGNQSVAGSWTTSGNVSAGSLTIGNGEAITNHFSHLFQNVPFNQALNSGTCVLLPPFTDPSLSTASDSDTVVVALPDAVIRTYPIVYAAWAGPSGSVNVRVCNPTGARIVLGVTGNVRIDVWKH